MQRDNQVSPTHFVKKARESNAKYTVHTCARNADLHQLKTLLQAEKHAKKVNKLDASGMAPLHYAARANNIEIARELLNAKAEPMIRDSEEATPLHYAARRKDFAETASIDSDPLAVIKELIDKNGCDINAQDRYKSTPLHICAMRGNKDVADLLLKYPNININIGDSLGCTPLHEAATYNNQEVADLLIKKGADVTIKDEDGCTALHLAAIEGHSAIVEQILESKEGENLLNETDNEDTMALHYAVESKDLQTIDLLLEKGANVNIACRNSKTGRYPLHLAAIAGDVDGEPALTTRLIDHGADVSKTDISEATALHKAAQYNNGEDAKVLMEKMNKGVDVEDADKYTPLMTAVAYGSKDITMQLLTKGAKTNVTDHNQKSIIYLAVENEEFEILKVILKHMASVKGSDENISKTMVNYPDCHGNSPLHVAAVKGNFEIGQHLLEYGADLNLKNDNEETPFIVACKKGRDKGVSAMLEKNEHLLNDEDEKSNTPLHVAAEGGHLKVVKELVKKGARKNARNNRSRTPLDLSAQAGHIEIVEYLLNEDVAPDPIDKEKVTPLQMASRSGHDSVVSLLIERGADVTCTDTKGKNCLDIAIESEQKSVVRAILKSNEWYRALANDSSDKTKESLEGSSDTSKPPENYQTQGTTPLRQLFRRMPDMALIALNRFYEKHEENKDTSVGEKYFDFNYDYLDDTYTDYGIIRDNKYVPSKKNSTEEPMLPKPYSPDLNHVKDNHPLMILIKENRDNLLGHAAVLTLIRNKWRVARVIYFIYMLIFLLYVSLITSFMLIAKAPHDINMTECEEATEWYYMTTYEEQSRFVIWILAILGLLKEIGQVYLQRTWYLAFPNVLDWYSFVSSIVLTCTFTNCGARTDWQWQMGAFTILFTWLDLILFLRRLPGLGIYVVMITEIWQTFMKFFVALFLFVLSFALTFHILAQDQDQFSSEFYSITKSFVMMIGEFDYGDIFFNEEEPLFYRNAVFAVFILFAFIISILVMNLMIGLAVDDVYGLREHAKSVKLAMQVELALDVELALPTTLRRKFKCHRRRYRYTPPEEITGIQSFISTVKRIVEGPLLSEKAIKKSLDQIQTGRLPELMLFEEKLTNKMKKLKTEVRSNADKMDALLDKMDKLLEANSKN